MSGRSRLTVRVIHADSTGPLMVFRSGEPVRPLVRDPLDVARFRREGYWDGWGDVYPPCECLRCALAAWSTSGDPR
ncbi:hypothetical protein [Streptomyces sp. NBC_01565]|uniref:hypothetical protein n=1 Tax=Streptomyces sp. NBC_01565 TaxID=2975881 RepID=UPI002250D062|nr:hypothetical protein [Streptomyces sp. NBC_01565]MCX4543861.1 hypothetical protein [Streptomyces sp. NBC_01565]